MVLVWRYMKDGEINKLEFIIISKVQLLYNFVFYFLAKRRVRTVDKPIKFELKLE